MYNQMMQTKFRNDQRLVDAQKYQMISEAGLDADHQQTAQNVVKVVLNRLNRIVTIVATFKVTPQNIRATSEMPLSI